MLRAVLFDAGDTLFRVRGSVGDAYAMVAARHGVAVVPHEIELRFRVASQQMPPLAFPDAPRGELSQREYAWWRQLVATAFGDQRFANFERFFRELFEYFADAAAWELFPDTGPALRALKDRGLRLGVVSNFDSRLVPICNGLGIAEDFEVIVMSASAGFAKPNPRIFEMTLRTMDIDRAEAIHIGDSKREDIEGAHAAGLRAILLDRDVPASRELQRVHDLYELLDRV